MMVTLTAFVAAAALALLHIYAGRLRSLNRIAQAPWLSIAGGVSVSFVFLHILPELSLGQETIEAAPYEWIAYFERHIYIISLIGLSFYYGLERAATMSSHRNPDISRSEAVSHRIFWPHVGAFAVYNALIGYLLFHQGEPQIWSVVLFAIAMGMHMSANDYSLLEHYQSAYAHAGRWILAIAVLLGWAVGSLVHLGEIVTAPLMAFLGGGIILNVMKEELPRRRESRFSFFALGAIIYSVLMLSISP